MAFAREPKRVDWVWMPMRVARKLLLGLALAGALALAVLPWWLGPALRPLARSQQVTFGRYERVGYARFRLHDVQRADLAVGLSARTVEADTPLLWAWRTLWRRDTLVAISDWSLADTGAPRAPNATGAPPVGVPELQTRVNETLDALARWLPAATLRSGAVRVGGLPEATIASVDWRQSELAARGIRIAGHEVELSLRRGPERSLECHAAARGLAARAVLRWTGATLEGEGAWHEQPLRLRARFPEAGWLPQEAELVATNWHLPAEQARLGNGLGELTGSGKLVWRDARFELTGDWEAVQPAQPATPPLRARIAAHGDFAAVTLSEFALEAPFASVTLSAPVTIRFDGPLQTPPAQLAVRADLSHQPWFEAAGIIMGTAEIRAADQAASVVFEAGCESLRVGTAAVRRATVAGEFHWPQLELRRLDLELDERSRIAGRGVADFQTKELGETVVRGTLTPDWFRHWLPANVEWGSAEFEATLAGPFAAPAHRGHATLGGARVAPVRPCDLALEWAGRGAAAERLEVTARGGDATLALAGSVAADAARLTELHWRRGGAEVLHLVAPGQVSWSQGWRVEGLQLAGPRSRVEVSVTRDERALEFRLAADEFEGAWLRDWFAAPGPEWSVNTLRAEGRTRDGTLNFRVDAAGQVTAPRGAVQLAVVAHGDREGIALERCELRDGEHMEAWAHGRLPARWSLEPGGGLQLDRAGELQLEAEARPTSPLWSELAASVGLAFDEPRVRLHLGGTPAAPAGEFAVAASRLAPAAAAGIGVLPPLEKLDLRLRADRGELVLETLSAVLEGQALRGRGHCPFGEGAWERLWRAPAEFDWREAEAELELPAADLRALAARWETFPLAQGRFAITARLERGLALSGFLRLTEGTTRPIPSAGRLQQVSADLELAGRTIVVRNVSGQLGGEPATVVGSIDLADFARPRVDLRLTGRNLPLVRRAGLLIRSDFDLAAKTDSNGATRLTGSVELRDSLVLADLRQLLPTGVRGVRRRPPYFAVSTEPFRDWQLDVALGGARGVRLHTPVLTGFATPRFQLEGTLGEPRAVGEVALEDGRILFPFAAFRVQLGLVRLAKADPFDPQLRLNAAVRRHGYDLHLEGRGSAEQPILTFSSVPALTSEQVLLLVMAGQGPGDTAGSIAGDRKRLTALGAYLGRGFLGGSGDEMERLTISSGEQTTQQGAETYLVEYLLGKRWSLIGEYDEFDDYNVGLKWRVYSQGGDDEAR
ncbi:MAG: translocation/assembly module TamB domain-containing protein [Opitutaceae bacterium]